MKDKDIQSKIDNYEWYHSINLTKDIKTPGRPILDLLNYNFIKFYSQQDIDFKGKAVLDIGCWDGIFSLDVEKRGASKILALDYNIRSTLTDFLIPYFNSKIEVFERNIYSVNKEDVGLFDIYFFPGVLYHLRYPFWAIKKIADLIKDGGALFIETAILSNNSNVPLLYCPAEGNEGPYGNNSVTFFNIEGLKDALRCHGLITKDVSVTDHNNTQLPSKIEIADTERAFLYCVKDESLRSSHTQSWCKGMD